MGNQGNQGGDREQQNDDDVSTPTGTSGRQGNTGTENWKQGPDQADRQTGEIPRRKHVDDEDSPLGNRNTFR